MNALWACLCLARVGAVGVQGDQAPAFAHVDAWFQRLCAEQQVGAAAVALGRPGGVVFAHGYGDAQPDSWFRLASVSKPLTAVTLLKLIEQGRARLDDRVVETLQLHPADSRWRAITLAQLLTHTAGFDRDRSGDPMFRSLEIAREQGVAPPARPVDVLAWMLKRPLDYAPGTRHVYSNFGYCLLGRVLERLTGLAYGEVVRREVLAPLGLTSLSLGRTLPADRSPREVSYLDPASGLASAVVGRIGARVPWPDGGFCLEAMDSHGGWIGSAPDLVRFALALDDSAAGTLLSADSLRGLTARPAGFEADGRPRAAYYALGWSVRPVGSHGLNVWHTGSLPGTAALLVRRWDGLVWAVLLNRRTGPTGTDLLGLVDPAMHRLVDAVAEWPTG